MERIKKERGKMKIEEYQKKIEDLFAQLEAEHGSICCSSCARSNYCTIGCFCIKHHKFVTNDFSCSEWKTRYKMVDGRILMNRI